MRLWFWLGVGCPTAVSLFFHGPLVALAVSVLMTTIMGLVILVSKR